MGYCWEARDCRGCVGIAAITTRIIDFLDIFSFGLQTDRDAYNQPTQDRLLRRMRCIQEHVNNPLDLGKQTVTIYWNTVKMGISHY